MNTAPDVDGPAIAFADGRLYLQIDDPMPVGGLGTFIGARAFAPTDRVRLVHVMSRPAGGEIHGYAIGDDGVLRLRLPCYTGPWPEMDAEVLARVPGARAVVSGVAVSGAVRP